MAGREKISARKMQNLGTAKLEHACKDIVHEYMDTKHPMALLKVDQEALNQLMEMATHERKEYLKGMILVNLVKLNIRLTHESDNVPARTIPTAIKQLYETLRDIEGEPSQRIEVNKAQFTNEQYNELLKRLPKTTEIIEEGEAMEGVEDGHTTSVERGNPKTGK